MHLRRLTWIALCLLCVAGVWFLRQETIRRAAAAKVAATTAAAVVPGTVTMVAAPLTNPLLVSAAEAKTNPLAYRLSNTTRSIGQLVGDPKAILLENALIDSSLPVNFSFPPQLRESGDPGAYIVQARGPVNAAFRALLARSGAKIVSYVPDNAYLVKIPEGVANALVAQPLVQSVIRWEPYYKIQSSLLGAAVHNLPIGKPLNLALFADNADQTIQQIEKLGGRILSQDTSPFGPVVRVQPPVNWTALAALPGVQIVEVYHPRVPANDLSRIYTGISADTLSPTNWMNLNGSNVTVVVADSGIDTNHPAFTTGGSPSAAGGLPIRVQGYSTNDFMDTDGHGTFIAGQIGGNGAGSLSPVPVGAVLAADGYGSVTNADFRGKAPLSTLYAISKDVGFKTLQEVSAGLTNALIVNNSWNEGDNTYNLDAASFDAATRDALSGVTGSQPMLFVFSAGNAGGGNNDANHDPGQGTANTIQSPATAKNVVTVGAQEEQRVITNLVTGWDGSTGAVWQAETSDSSRVAWFSSRGNVGINIEGPTGRFKPDVVAPGTFIVSTRSSQWDTNKVFYRNPTNASTFSYPDIPSTQFAPGSLWVNPSPVIPDNAISINVNVTANGNSPQPFPTNLPIYVGLAGDTNFSGTPPTMNNQFNIPPDGGLGIADILNSQWSFGFNFIFAVSNSTSQPFSFDVALTITDTNAVGNELLVLSNLDNTLGPYYRFESGTSMAAADVSGTLALIQDFFTNTLHTLPSPALLKAMLINGARPFGYYDLQVKSAINYAGWGLVNLPNSLPPGVQTSHDGTQPTPIFFQDQSTTNALATGDSQTFTLAVKTNAAVLRVTLVWTDPPGNPAAAIKLVNSLELVVTNMDNPTNPIIYLGNNIPAGYVFSVPQGGTNIMVPDSINNVQNVIIPPYLGTNYSITVIGRSVNVNAVSAQTNNSSGVFAPNVVQDFALVISSADTGVTGSFTVTPGAIVSNPTGAQDITYISTTNQPLLNQFVGANAPLLGTNSTPVGANTIWGTNGAVVLGMTNQWHFYVVKNTGTASDFTNAAFVTFLPPELSVPRTGVFADPAANATRPQADIDLYVTTDSNLLILSPLTISNCLSGAVTPSTVFNGVSLSRLGAEYVVDTNSTPGEVYYIGVKSEDQMGSEYDFLPVFSNIPFSGLDENGDEHVTGIPVPVGIPDGTPANPGVNYVMGIAMYPINVGDITVTNRISHQNFGDLYGTLSHNAGTEVVLNNHDGWHSVTNQVFIYNDANIPNVIQWPQVPLPNPILSPPDGPGSLQTFLGQDGTGVWRLTEVDTALTQTGSIQSFTMFIKKKTPLGNGIGVTNTLAPQTWFYDFVDVPAGATNLTIGVTNLTSGGLKLLDVFVKLGAQPTTNNYDKMAVVPLPPPLPPGISITIGPTDLPPLQPGRYWIGVFNTDPNLADAAQTFSLFATILPANPTGTSMDFAATGSTPLLDDAVTNASIYVSTNLPVVSVNVGIRVQHPRISDLDFILVSPSGTRVDLMQNRGGSDANGAGSTIFKTNIVPAISNGGQAAQLQTIDTGTNAGTITINYEFYTLPDTLDVYYDGVDICQFAPAFTGFDISGTTNINYGPGSSTQITIVINQGGNTNFPTTAWDYTLLSPQAEYHYLMFTENTNFTTTPIKYAVPPFVPALTTPTNLFTSSFEGLPSTDYITNQVVAGLNVTANEVSVAADPTNAYDGSNFLALASGTILTNLPTVPGQNYSLSFAYRGPGIVAWWRGQSNAVDSINGNNVTNTPTGILYTNRGEVGSAFSFGGTLTSRRIVPPSASLAVSNLTLEAWVDQGVPSGAPVSARPVIIYGGPGERANIQLWINTTNTTISTPAGVAPGAIHALVRDAGGVSVLEVDDPNPIVGTNKWVHLAFTANLTTGIGILYCNGLPVMTNATPTPITCQSFQNVNLGYLNAAATGEPLAGRTFLGWLDEVSIYNRPLSASEINAIYTAGTAGKFDPTVFTTSPAQSLAEARVSLGNETPATILGTNTTWQTTNISFTATQTQTPIQIAGIEPGMLLDDFVLTQEPGDLYYLPEQSLAAFTGEGARGDWKLEIQDDRAGGFDTNSPPVLLSWDLQFVFANTNAVPTVIHGGTGLNNQFVPPNTLAWYQVTVPANAHFATNILWFASLPVNVWFSTNVPPSITNSAGGDYNLVPDSTGNSGSPAVLSTATTPFIVLGATYYLGVENTNAATVNYGIQVNFDVAGLGSSLTLSSVSAASSGTTLKWTAAADAQFQMQWADTLAQPWNTDSQIITSSDGNFIYTDDGSQTAPQGPMRFYRLVQISSGTGGFGGRSP